ncbi:MAG: BolA family transcriptional regulator [Hyphomicrobiaceae bacterium]|nr:BolA family transcriptional regulator [Hyphomicrobiaceae bacterium]MCC0023831.1 BolA family transcriptional regulator [Hyphomicrobiaceae bacterium]
MTSNRQDSITDILNRTFSPDHLEVIDESGRHAGHAGARPEGQTHYRIKISAQHFDALGRVAQHRAIMDALESEFESGLHALAIEVLPRGEVIQPQVEQPGA